MAPRQAPYVICYLCGRKYGTKSITIHEPHCLKKWHEDNKKLPKHLRRKQPPSKPDYGLLASGDFNDEVMDKMNEMSFQAAQDQLIPCDHCGRTFLPERLQVHQRSCTVEKPFSRPRTVIKGRTTVPDAQPLRSSSRESNKISSRSKPIAGKNPTFSTRPPTRQNSSEIISGSTTMECIICKRKIQVSNIQIHLLKCSSENHNPTDDDKDEKSDTTQQIERPQTSVLKRRPLSQKNIPQEETHVLDDNEINNYNQNMSTNVDKVPDNLIECFLCNRKFASDRIDKHQSICKKTKTKQRKVFNSSKQRVIDNGEGVSSVKKLSVGAKAVPKSNWRQTHEDFIRSIRSAKKVSEHLSKGGKVSDLPPPPPSLNPDYVHCKYCDRRFNATVAERHIPKCATTMNRPAPPKVKALEVYKKSPNKPPSRNINNHKIVNKGRTSRNQSPTERHSFSREASRNKPRISPLINDKNGFLSPRVQNRYDEFETKLLNTRKNSRTPNKARATSYDPYKPKTFTGASFKQTPSRGFSYNAANYTGPNFFG